VLERTQREVGIVVVGTRMLQDGRCVMACLIPEYLETFVRVDRGSSGFYMDFVHPS
jgi:hypothetical protein